MTISSSTNKSGPYTCNGSTDTFAYAFRILDDDHITVEVKTTSTGAITTLVKTTDYTVTGVGDASGGNVVLVDAAGDAPSGTTLTITRNVPQTQETDYTEYDTFPAQSHEDALDKLTMINQQQTEELDRTIKFDSAVDLSSFNTELSATTAGRFLAINSTGTGLTLAEDTSVIGGLSKADGTFYVGDGTTVAAKTGAAARASLGVTIGSDVQAYDAGLASIAGLTTAADKMIYTTGSDTYAVTDLTATARSLLDDASTSAMRTTLGLAIGSNVQAYHANLASISGLTPASSLIIGNGLGGFEMVTPANFITNNNILNTTDIGSSVQAELSGASLTSATVATGDKVLVQDADDSDNLKTVTAQSIADLAPGASSASDTAAGIIEIAVQSEMESASSTTLAVTPGRQHYHPSAAKAWVVYNQITGPGISASYNVTSVTDNSTGLFTVNFTNNFSSTSFAHSGHAGADNYVMSLNSRSAGSVSVTTRVANTSALTDLDNNSVIAFGDQ